MKEYEILVETMNPCGGASHAKKEFIEAEAESPGKLCAGAWQIPDSGDHSKSQWGCDNCYRRFQGVSDSLYLQ